MKRLFLSVLLILLFALPAYAQQCNEMDETRTRMNADACPDLLDKRLEVARLSPAMMGSVPVAAPSETYEFRYNVDYPSHTDYAYGPHGVGFVDGTLSGATAVAGGTDPGTASGDGGNVLKCAAWNHYATFPVTAKDIFDSAQGFIDFQAYFAATTGVNTIIELYGNSTNYIHIYAETANTLMFKDYSTGGTVVYARSTATITNTTWERFQVKWDTTANTVKWKKCTSQTDCTNDFEAGTTDANLIPLAVEPAVVRVCTGGNFTWTNTFYVDNVQIWTTADGT